MDVPVQIDQIVEIAATYSPLEESEEARLIEEVRPIVQKDAEASQNGKSSLFWLHDTSVPDGPITMSAHAFATDPSSRM